MPSIQAGESAATQAFRLPEICQQVLASLEALDRLRMISLNRQVWELTSREVWRGCNLQAYRMLDEQIGATERRQHYADCIHSLSLDSATPSLVDGPDATFLFTAFPHLCKVTWANNKMLKLDDGSFEIDVGTRYVISLGATLKPPPIPDWQWGDPGIKVQYRLTLLMHGPSKRNAGPRAEQIRAGLGLLMREPISRLQIDKHTWTGDELAVVADVLEERNRDTAMKPIGTINFSFHMTHCTALLKPLKRIVALGTIVTVELVPCRPPDVFNCNDVREAHLYSLIAPYITHTAAWFTVTVAQDGRGGYFETGSTVQRLKDDFPLGLVDEITYTCYVSRLFSQWTEETRLPLFREAYRPFATLWTKVAGPGCSKVVRDHADFLELLRGNLDQGKKAELIATADRAAREELEKVGLVWGVVDGDGSAEGR